MTVERVKPANYRMPVQRHRYGMYSNVMKIRQIGFTLIELLVVVVMMAIVASLAVPSFQSLMARRAVSAAADALIGDLRYARSEAIKRSARVSICRSANGTTCSGAAGLWKDGWIVFVDANGNGTFEAGDEIVRAQQALSSIASIVGPTPVNDRPSFTYQPTGWAKAANQPFTFTTTGSGSSSATLLLCINNQGRPSVRPAGTTVCLG